MLNISSSSQLSFYLDVESIGEEVFPQLEDTLEPNNDYYDSTQSHHSRVDPEILAGSSFDCTFDDGFCSWKQVYFFCN